MKYMKKVTVFLMVLLITVLMAGATSAFAYDFPKPKLPEDSVTTSKTEKKKNKTVTVNITTDKDGNFIQKETITEKISKKGTKTVNTFIEMTEGMTYEIKESEYPSGKTISEALLKQDGVLIQHLYELANPDNTGKLTSYSFVEGTEWYSEASRKKDGTEYSMGKADDGKGHTKLVETTTKPDGTEIYISKITNADTEYDKYEKKITYPDKSSVEIIRKMDEGSLWSVKDVRDADGTYHISSVDYSADGTEVVIDDYLYGNRPINVIEKKAFKNNKTLKTIIIKSDKITEVGKQAFKGINTDVVIKIKADESNFNRIVKLIKKSGINKKVTFERITDEEDEDIFPGL